MSAVLAPNTPILSISQLNRQVRLLLENSLGSLWVEGEISNFSVPFSGHWYLSLKDSDAQVRCAMFKGANARVGFKPQDGQRVLAKVSVGLYEPRGDYQLIIERMLPAGDGVMQMAFEQLKMKLASEGLFSEAHKKPLPTLPMRVGLITSASGAALQDILAILKRRAPIIELVIYPCAVQGEQAAMQIRAMLNTANERNEVDLLVIARGGGSKEDLWCFNDEALARCIFASHLPIISAVGHEIDFTICDFVADLRAATPSAAAELLSQSFSHLEKQLQRQARLSQLITQRLERAQQHLHTLTQRLQAQAPEHKLQRQQQQLDYLCLRLSQQMQTQLSAKQRQLSQASSRLEWHGAGQLIAPSKYQLEALAQRLCHLQQQSLAQQKRRFEQQVTKLDALSPLKVLSRGYAIVSKDQASIHSQAQLNTNDCIDLHFHDGHLKARIC